MCSKGRSIISRLKDLFWKLLRRPIKCSIFLKEIAASCWNRIKLELGMRFPEGSDNWKVMADWKDTCGKFQSSAIQARLKAMYRDDVRHDADVQNRVNALVANMNSNMDRLEYIETRGVVKSVLPRDPFTQSDAVRILSTVIFETMLHRIENGYVINEAVLNEAESFVVAFNRLLQAVKNRNEIEALICSAVMWGKLSLHIFDNDEIVDQGKKDILMKCFLDDLGSESMLYMDSDKRDRVPKEYGRFVLLMQYWSAKCTIYGAPKYFEDVIMQLRNDGIRNIPESWNTDDLIYALIMNKLNEIECFDPDQDEASFDESLKEWRYFTEIFAKFNYENPAGVEDIRSLLALYINNETQELCFDLVF